MHQVHYVEVFDAYCERKQVLPEQVGFFFMGKRLDRNKTAKDVSAHPPRSHFPTERVTRMIQMKYITAHAVHGGSCAGEYSRPPHTLRSEATPVCPKP